MIVGLLIFIIHPQTTYAADSKFEGFVHSVFEYGANIYFDQSNNVVKNESYTLDGQPLVFNSDDPYTECFLDVVKTKDTIVAIVDEVMDGVYVFVATLNPKITFAGGIKVGSKMSDVKKSGVLKGDPQHQTYFEDITSSTWISDGWLVMLNSKNDVVSNIFVLCDYEGLEINPKALFYPE